MHLATNIEALAKQVSTWKAAGLRIGFVPTMGNLHDGHISLVNKARESCDKVVVSIFVNPMQFNDIDDFHAYPKTLRGDTDKLEAAKADMVFLPDVDMMYPGGQQASTRICVPDLTAELEGAFRPGHFDGVTTIVNKLFNQVQPNVAYFGEKDYQQLQVVKKMVADLNMPIDIVAVATQRETDGLAMSSRNSRLNSQQRQLAPDFYRILSQLEKQASDDSHNIESLEQSGVQQLTDLGFEVEYVSFRHALTLKAVESGQAAVLLAAVKLGDIRLIDMLKISNLKTN